MILLPNIFWPKFVLDLSYDSQNIHVQNTFLTDSEQIQNFWEIILDQNVCVPKFLLDLGYDSQNIHAQNTFMTDSKQIKRNLDNFVGSNYFLTQNIFGS